jgi:hypothetical protein
MSGDKQQQIKAEAGALVENAEAFLLVTIDGGGDPMFAKFCPEVPSLVWQLSGLAKAAGDLQMSLAQSDLARSFVQGTK